MRYMTRMLHNTAMLGFQLQPSIYLSIYQAMGDAPRDLVSLDLLEGNVLPLHRTDSEDHLHLARLRRPPPKAQRVRACSEPPGNVQARKPKISKECLRKASKERYEISTAPHPTGLASETLLKLPEQPSSEAVERAGSSHTVVTLQHEDLGVLPTPSQSEVFRSNTPDHQAMMDR